MNIILMIMYIYTFIIICSIAYIMRNSIRKLIYGDARIKRYIIIDTGETGYTTLNEDRNLCTINGKLRSVNVSNIIKGIIYFVDDSAENMKMESATPKRWEFYCNSDEFDTIGKNNILRQFLYIAEKNYLMITLVIVSILLFLSMYSLIQLNELKTIVMEGFLNGNSIPDVISK